MLVRGAASYKHEGPADVAGPIVHSYSIVGRRITTSLILKHLNVRVGRTGVKDVEDDGVRAGSRARWLRQCRHSCPGTPGDANNVVVNLTVGDAISED